MPRMDTAVRVVNEVGYTMQIFSRSLEEYEPPDPELMAAAIDILADGWSAG